MLVDAGDVSNTVNDSRSRTPHDDDDDSDVGGRAMLGGAERQRLLIVGAGSLVAGASLVALITFATDRFHVCIRHRRRSFLSSARRPPRFTKPEPEIVAAPPSLSSPSAEENQVRSRTLGRWGWYL